MTLARIVFNVLVTLLLGCAGLSIVALLICLWRGEWPPGNLFAPDAAQLQNIDHQ